MKPLLAAAGAEQGFVFTSHHRLATDQQLSLKWRTLSWTLLLLRRHLLRRQIVLHSSDVEGHAAPLGVFGFNEIHMSLQWHQTDIWPFKKTCMLMVCDVPLFRSGPSLIHKNLHFDPLLLGFWVVMNIIKSLNIVSGIASRGSPCVLPSPSLALRSEYWWREAWSFVHSSHIATCILWFQLITLSATEHNKKNRQSNTGDGNRLGTRLGLGYVLMFFVNKDHCKNRMVV